MEITRSSQSKNLQNLM